MRKIRNDKWTDLLAAVTNVDGRKRGRRKKMACKDLTKERRKRKKNKMNRPIATFRDVTSCLGIFTAGHYYTIYTRAACRDPRRINIRGVAWHTFALLTVLPINPLTNSRGRYRTSFQVRGNDTHRAKRARDIRLFLFFWRIMGTFRAGSAGISFRRGCEEFVENSWRTKAGSGIRTFPFNRFTVALRFMYKTIKNSAIKRGVTSRV